jgi:hypothetical protein
MMSNLNMVEGGNCLQCIIDPGRAGHEIRQRQDTVYVALT